MTIVLFQIFLRTEIRVWRLADILVHCLLFHRKCRWTSTWIEFFLWKFLVSHLISTANVWLLHWAATCWILGNIPLEFHWLIVDSVKVSVILKKISTIPIFVPMHRSIGGVLENLPRAQHRIRKDVDLRALKIDNSFVTKNDRYFHEWFSQPIVSNPEISFCSDTNLVDMSSTSLSVRSVVFAMDWQLFRLFFPTNTADPIVTAIKIHQITECFSPSSVTFDIRFCLVRTWSFTRFTNDLDSTDNSNSASSFPMTNCWGHAPRWGRTTGVPGHSRGITSFTTDCAVPSSWVSSWEKPGWVSRVALQELSSGLPDRSYISESVFHSWEDQARSSSHFE